MDTIKYQTCPRIPNGNALIVVLVTCKNDKKDLIKIKGPRVVITSIIDYLDAQWQLTR